MFQGISLLKSLYQWPYMLTDNLMYNKSSFPIFTTEYRWKKEERINDPAYLSSPKFKDHLNGTLQSHGLVLHLLEKPILDFSIS